MRDLHKGFEHRDEHDHAYFGFTLHFNIEITITQYKPFNIIITQPILSIQTNLSFICSFHSIQKISPIDHLTSIKISIPTKMIFVNLLKHINSLHFHCSFPSQCTNSVRIKRIYSLNVFLTPIMHSSLHLSRISIIQKFVSELF